MKKILIIANHASGLYKFRKELLQELLSQNMEVYAALPTNHENAKKIEELGVKLIATKLDRRGMNPIRDFKLMLQYWKITKQIKPDIILTYTIKPNIYGGMVARIRKIPNICTITGVGTAFQKDNFVRKFLVKLYQIALKNAKCVFFQNASNQELFTKLQIVAGKTKIVPGSGVNLQENCFEKYPEKKGLKFIFVGRIMKEKGIYEFLEMAKYIKSQNENVVFKVYGDSEEEEAKNLLDQYAQEKIVEYVGYQNEMHKAFQEASCLIVPSYHEGTSNVMLEAAATGRPIIASNIPGCKEIINQGETGFVFEVKNIADLTQKVQCFIDLSEQEKIQMGQKARKKVEQEFDRKMVINSYLEEIKED